MQLAIRSLWTRRTHKLIRFFFKTQCWKAVWPEGSSVCCAVCRVKYHTLAPPVPAPLSTVHSLRSNCDLKCCPNCLRGCSRASVPGMLNPVSYHPLLTWTSLDHQAKAKVGVFGHFYLQASAGVPADDWTILQQKHRKLSSDVHNNLIHSYNSHILTPVIMVSITGGSCTENFYLNESSNITM